MKSKKEDSKKKFGTQVSLQTQIDKKERQTLTSKCGLIFPVARVLKKMRKGRYAERIASNSAIGVSAVLEYLTAEILEMAGDKIIDSEGKSGSKIIKPRHICLAVNEDEEMSTAIGKNVIIPMGGVIPFIHEELEKMPKRRKRNKMLEGMKDDMAEDSGDDEEDEEESTGSDEDQ